MKSFFVFFLTLFFCGSNFSLGEKSSSKLRVFCSVTDHTRPITKQEDLSLDEVCTDVLYRIPFNKRNIYWIYPFNQTDGLLRFRQHHPNVRLYTSVEDSQFYPIINSPYNVNRLIALLKKTNSVGLNVLVNSTTELAFLTQVLQQYQRILSNQFFELTITIDSAMDIHSMVEHAIDVIVDAVFYIPSAQITTGQKDIDFSSVKRFVSPEKLVIGLPSIFLIAPASKKPASVPTMSELCSKSTRWKPNSQANDHLTWDHEEHDLKIVTKTARAIKHQIASISENTPSIGIFLFDLTFRIPNVDICSRHKALFDDSIRQAIEDLSGKPIKRVKRVPTDSLPSPKQPAKLTKTINRTGKILIFSADEDENEQPGKSYSVHDEDSPLPSSFDHLILGYDDSGKIYDIYQQMPSELNETLLLNTIHLYYVDKILGGGGERVLGSTHLRPPEILVYPDSFSHRPVPILVTWVKMVDSVIKFIPRKTRRPSTQQTVLPAPSTTTTQLPSTDGQESRLCMSGQKNSFQRCMFPAGLMELLNLGIGLSTTTTSTRKPTTIRLTTAKPIIPVHPYARLTNGSEDVGQTFPEKSVGVPTLHTNVMERETPLKVTDAGEKQNANATKG